MKAELSNDIKQLMKDTLDGKLSQKEIEENIDAVNAFCSLTKALEKDRYDTFNKILEKDRYIVKKGEAKQFFVLGEPGLHNAFMSYTDTYTNENFHVIKLKTGKGLEERTESIAVKDIRNGWVHEKVSYMPAEVARRVIDGYYP